MYWHTLNASAEGCMCEAQADLQSNELTNSCFHCSLTPSAYLSPCWASCPGQQFFPWRPRLKERRKQRWLLLHDIYTAVFYHYDRANNKAQSS